MAYVRAAWGEIRSQYDCLLAVNPHPAVPADKMVFWTRCRAWVNCMGYSQELNAACLKRFSADPAGGWAEWRFDVPRGGGLTLRLEIKKGRNRVRLVIKRMRNEELGIRNQEDCPVTVILRPDIEWRNFHHTTKAGEGLKKAWQDATALTPGGFTFTPDGRGGLSIGTSRGTCRLQPEWLHDIPHPEEQKRGLDPSGDLYSPAWFEIPLGEGEEATLQAGEGDIGDLGDLGETGENGLAPTSPESPSSPRSPLATALSRALSLYVVKRNDSRTIIAGYPWFLDWGRDTLIALRGLIAGGRHETALDILREFARFERDGTLPNMIRAEDDANRETSDAPLWLCVVVGDLIRNEELGELGVRSEELGVKKELGSRSEELGVGNASETKQLLTPNSYFLTPNSYFLTPNSSLLTPNSSIRAALLSIVTHYRDGTPNGIRMDPESGLIYSPAHYTWMDTNYPAATPRQGYPVEIQALWIHALRLVAQHIDASWGTLADQAADSLARYFATPEGWLADCLRAAPGVAAKDAEQEDALRPNQLLAVTLGALRDRETEKAIVRACECLLVPGAIRSLADRPVKADMSVVRDGVLLNDPHRPYQGRYIGDEDTRRKPAYHNGTAWTWQFPLYVEALVKVYGAEARDAGLSLLGSSVELLNQGALGHLPEICDGDAPHTPRGCSAQAWGMTELLRVWTQLEAM